MGDDNGGFSDTRRNMDRFFSEEFTRLHGKVDKMQSSLDALVRVEEKQLVLADRISNQESRYLADHAALIKAFQEKELEFRAKIGAMDNELDAWKFARKILAWLLGFVTVAGGVLTLKFLGLN